MARALRREARLSLADMAGAVGASEATISRWETGKRRPRGAHADRYAALLNRLEDDLRHDY